MVMDPRTHPRGTAPDFTLPKRNPNPERMTDALWWLVCMREALEPDKSENGGTIAAKPGYHSWGSRLPDHGEGNSKTDHSIRRGPDREGPWWRSKSSAHDWTFRDAQSGKYETIIKYTRRLINAMRDPDDLRPDAVYAYTLGQVDGDVVVEDVIKDSPGEAAGLKPGDKIIAIDNNFSGNIQAYKSLLQVPNTKLKIIIMRNDKVSIVSLYVKSIL